MFQGYCRRFPPTAFEDDEATSMQPEVNYFDWCGEFKAMDKDRGMDYLCYYMEGEEKE